MKRIAIQGELGSFHDITAHQYFEGEQIELICCATFEEVFENIKRDPTVIGITAIENTIAGSLLHNYELLRQSGTTVVGEHRLHIEHSICCLPEDDWSTLQEVHSHPVALMQCGKFLANHPDLKAVEAEDTAGSRVGVFPRYHCPSIFRGRANRVDLLRYFRRGLREHQARPYRHWYHRHREYHRGQFAPQLRVASSKWNNRGG